MKAYLGTGSLALALLLAGCGGESGSGNSSGAAAGPAAAAIPPPNGAQWSATVAATPDGGFVMGNPNAPIKLVEFGSFTCPHCAEFAERGVPQLVDKYVNTGRVSYEYRNYVRDSADLGAALLSRCGGAGPFFKLSDQIFAAQDEWIGKLQNMSPAEQQQLQSLPPAQATAAMADRAGLVQFVRVRGVPAEKAQACLTNQGEIEKLVEMANKANTLQIPGTPAFLINGDLVEDAASWETLEPALRKASGG